MTRDEEEYHPSSCLRTQEGRVSAQRKRVRTRWLPRRGVRVWLDALDVREQIELFLPARLALGDIQVAGLDHRSGFDHQNERQHLLLSTFAVAG